MSFRKLVVIGTFALAVPSSPPGVAGTAVEACSPSSADEAEDRAILRHRSETFGAAREALLGAGTKEERENALLDVVNLLSSTPCLGDRIVPFLEELRWGREQGVVVLAETALARHQNRELNLRLLAGVGYSPRPPQPAPIRQDDLEMLADPDPNVRLAGIERIMEVAVAHELRVEKAVNLSLEWLARDRDPRVARRAEFAVEALAGDPGAVGQVYLWSEPE